MEKLICESCGSNLNVASMNERLSIISCTHCGSNYDASRFFADKSTEAQKTSKVKPDLSIKPSTVKVRRDNNAIVYSIRWHPIATAIFRVLFSSIWLGFVSHFVLLKVLDERSWLNTSPIDYGPFHWLVIIGFIWFGSAQILNSMKIRLSSRLVKISHGPIPWPVRKTITTDSLQQLFVAKKITVEKKGARNVKFYLHAVDDKNKLVKIPGRFTSALEALYVEREIEKELDLVDAKMPNEI